MGDVLLNRVGFGRLGAVFAMLAAASKGVGEAAMQLKPAFDDFAASINIHQGPPKPRNRRGRGTRKLPRGRPGWVAPFNTVEDAQRAVRRYERYVRNKGRVNMPSHIHANMVRAMTQFPAKTA